MTEFDPYRKCRHCGFEGYMAKWYRASFLPTFITFFLLACGVAPGMVFYAVNKNKLICPECGHTRN